jgi:hypothetical protein
MLLLPCFRHHHHLRRRSNLTPQQRKMIEAIPGLLKKMLMNQLDPAAVNASLDQIKRNMDEISKTLEQHDADQAERRVTEEKRQKDEEIIHFVLRRSLCTRTNCAHAPLRGTGGRCRQFLWLDHFVDPTPGIRFRSGDNRTWVVNIKDRIGGGATDYWQLTTDK